MKPFRGKAMTFFALAVVILTFLGLISAAVVSSDHARESDSYKVTINGQYAVDGGDWQDTIPGEMIHERFHTAVIKGRISSAVFTESSSLVATARNIWYRIQFDDGIEYTNLRESDYSSRQDTPGSSIRFIPRAAGSRNALGSGEITVTLIYPYQMFSNADLSDFFNLYVTDTTGIHELILEQKLPILLLSLVICFFGLFAFPIAGSVLGGINVRYLAFSVLCFFTGVHLMFHALYEFLPLWINNPVLCMSICESTSHLLGICLLVFIKVTLVDQKHSFIGNIILMIFSLLIIVLFALNIPGIIDLYASKPNAQMLFTVCSVILTVCVFRELKINHDALLALITTIPLAAALLFDTVNTYLGISDLMFFEVGATITLLIQIINLLYDLRRQYQETLRYQEMQRELTESRVAIMVSQIQPHFLYNSLSSIAMMCTIDPETAQEATVTFADYLRGNMDSLKQKEPVPFSKELEHLKKYLYIEKLRFGKKLNIVYDIETEDFVLPQLSIQLLAENAVKHGISKKRGGGTLTITARETDDSFEVIVSDDGKGFDVNEVKDDGRSHVGMDNVRRRLKEMCGGEVIINSVIGEGTTATVILPKEGQKHENTVR